MNWLLIGGALAAGAILLKKKKVAPVTPSTSELVKAQKELDKMYDEVENKIDEGVPAGTPPDIAKLYMELLNCLMKPKATGCKVVLDQFYFAIGGCLKTPTTPVCKAVLQTAWIVLGLCVKHPAIGACPDILAMAKAAGVKIPAAPAASTPGFPTVRAAPPPGSETSSPRGAALPPRPAVITKIDQPTNWGKIGIFLGTFWPKSGTVVPAYPVRKVCYKEVTKCGPYGCACPAPPGKSCNEKLGSSQKVTVKLTEGEIPATGTKTWCNYVDLPHAPGMPGIYGGTYKENQAARALLYDFCLGRTKGAINSQLNKAGLISKGTKQISGCMAIMQQMGSKKKVPFDQATGSLTCDCAGMLTLDLVKVKGPNFVLFYAVDCKKMPKKTVGGSHGCGTGGYYSCD